MAGSSSHAGGVGDHDDNWFISDLEVDKNINGDLAWASNRCIDDLVHDDLSGQNHSPSNIDNILEEMFGEYQQLLNSENHAQLLDSFVDSLLA
jgi:myb proto-oncogene protein